MRTSLPTSVLKNEKNSMAAWAHRLHDAEAALSRQSAYFLSSRLNADRLYS